MEIWNHWEPIEGAETKFYKESLVDSTQGLVLTFQEALGNKKLIVTFNKRILSYRNTDEGALLEMLHTLDQNYGKNFYGKRSLFEVKNSEYINWFIRESSGVYTKEEVKHYVFLTSDDVIEVLSSYAPDVSLN